MPVNNVKGRIHSIETCGTVDGPGIRYIIFTQGCHLRCQYCHNPDTWNIDLPNVTEQSVSDTMKDIRKYKSFMKFSGGGVTVSGGEPLIQHEFVRELFKSCREENIHTTLDTSGYAELEHAKSVLEYTDLVLLDIKSFNKETYKKITGREIEPTLNILNYTKEKDISVWIRFVFVPGLSDDLDDIEKMAEFIAGYNNVEKIDILPFHKMGEYKWEKLNLNYKLKDTPEPTQEEINKVKSIFKKHNL